MHDTILYYIIIDCPSSQFERLEEQPQFRNYLLLQHLSTIIGTYLNTITYICLCVTTHVVFIELLQNAVHCALDYY